MKTIAKTRSIGGSLVVTIPSEIVKREMLRKNEFVELEIKKSRKDYFGMLRGVGSFSQEDEMEGQFE